MNKKSKFLTVLLLVVLALSMALFGVACKKDNGDTSSSREQTESKTATYYTDTADGEYIVELFGNDFLLKIGSETLTGKFTLNGGTINFVTEQGTFEGTITGDEIDFTYGDKQYLMLEKVYRTVTFSDGTTQKVLNGKTAVKPAADPAAPENMKFVGWYSSEDYESLYNFGAPVRNDVNVYARMVDSPVGSMVYTATAVYDDDTKVEYKTVNGIIYGLEDLADKDGKAFDGWYVSDFNSADKLTYKYNENITLNQNVNLYPVWKDGITGLSVYGQKVTWDSYAVGAQYKIEVRSTVSAGGDGQTSQTELGVANYLTAAGEYAITVSTGDVSKTVYYNNKALARPTVEIIDGTTVKYNAVANAEKYYVTVDCGNKDHRHEEFDNGASTVYDISSCEMQKGGIKVYVRAVANGYVSATSDVCRFERNLDAVSGIAINGNTLVWNAVDKAVSYVVVVDKKEYDAGAENSYSLKTVDAGKHTVGVYPVAKGYNSPDAVTTAYNKVQLAAPTGVTVVNGNVVWNKVEGATSYTVKIGDKAVTSDTNSVEFKSEYMSGKSSVEVSVSASSGDTASESDYSDVCTVNYAAINNVKYENGVVSWDPVATANGYVITIGENKTVVKNGTSAKVRLNQSGLNEIRVAYTLSVNGEDREISYKTVQVTAYEVKFYNNDGTYKTVYAAYGDEISVAVDEVPGYVFSGWYDVPNGGKNNGNKYASATLNKAGDISLYAYYATQKYTVTFDTVGGSLDVESKDVYYSEDYVLPIPVSFDENLVFGGWYSDVNGAGTRYTDNSGNSIKGWSLAENVTVKANWLKLLNYTLNQTNDGYLVTGGVALSEVTTVTIPVNYAGKPVKSVDDLSTGTALISVNIPDSVSIVTGDGQGISSSAFKACKSLAAINVYKSGTGAEAKYVSYDGVVYSATFDGNDNVTSATLFMIPLAKTGEMKLYDKTTTINSYAFSGSSIEKVIVPTSVKTVKSYAFTSCSKLTEVVFENEESAEPLTIESEAFKTCSYLTKVTLPARLAASSYTKTVAPSTENFEFVMPFDQTIFTSCNRLAEVNVEGTYAKAVYSSVDGIIYSADGRTIIFCPRARADAVTTGRATTIASGAFEGCTKINSVEIGAAIRTIDAGAFYGCTGLSDLKFEGTKEDSSLTIKTAAFYKNTSLAALKLPENLYGLEAYAFGDTSALKKVEINSVGYDGKVEFADFAFGTNARYKTYNVQSVTIGAETPAFAVSAVLGSSIMTLDVQTTNANFVKGEKDEYYTADGTMLVYTPGYLSGEFTVKDGVKVIAANVFTKNVKLKSVVIPASVEKIGEAAFYNCSALKSVTFADGENVGTKLDIENHAFNQCSALTKITFPERLTYIGVLAFNNNTSLTSVTFTGNKLKTIGTTAFQFCRILTEIDLPEGLETIGDQAFYWCNILERVSIPSTVTEIGNAVFTGDAYLSDLSVAEESVTFVVKDGILYKTDANKNAIELILCPVGNGGDEQNKVVIPNTVTTVAEKSFQNNKNIKEIIFEDNAENSKRDLEIGDSAFYVDSSNVLRKIVLPEGMTVVGYRVFYGARADEIVIPTTVTVIQKGAFYCCYASSVKFTERAKNGDREPTSLTIESGTTVAEGAFYNAVNLTGELVFPEGTKTIGDFAFASAAKGVTKIVIPSTVETIGASAFMSLTKLTEVDITDTEENVSKLTSVGAQAFMYCDKLQTVNLPKSLTEIATKAFNATGITSLHVPANVVTIGSEAFRQCLQLESVSFAKDSQLTTIEASVFSACSRLTSVGTVKAVTENEVSTDKFVEGALPSGLTTIGANAFNNANLSKVVIPYGVTSIGASAFAYNDLESVEFETGEIEITVKDTDENGDLVSKTVKVQGSSISSFGSSAFEGTGINTFTIPETASDSLSLGSAMFKGCYNLETLNVPSCLKKGLESALNYCVTLKNVNIAQYNENYTAENGIIYNKDKDTIIYLYAKPSVDENGVLTITAKNVGSSIYSGLPFIKKVVFGKSITTIGSSAFKNCVNLTEVEFAKDSGNITEIEASAFEGCTALQKVTNFPKSINTIGASAFKGCSSLTSSEFLGNDIVELGASAFESSGLTAINLPTKLETLNGNVFKSTAAVKNPVTITLPNTLKTLGANAFNGIKIAAITLPEGLVTIGNSAFNASFNSTACAKTVTIPSTVTTIGTSVFSGCTNLTDVTFADGSVVSSIGASVFSGCSKLTDVEFPESLISLGDKALEKCIALVSVDLPSTLEKLGANAFNGCTKLTEVNFAKDINLTDIGSNTFTGCTALKSISIPEGVKVIGDNAFSKCSSLETVKLPTTLEVIGTVTSTGTATGYTFNECAKLTHIELPDALTYMGPFTFYKSGLEEIVVPENVKYLTRNNKLPSAEGTTSTNKYYQTGYHVVDESSTSYKFTQLSKYMAGQFADCANLTKVTLPASLEAIGPYLFYKTPKLTDVTYTGYKGTGNALPSGLKELGGFTFSQSAVDSITLMSDATVYDNAFADSDLVEVDMGVCESVTDLPAGIFAYTDKLNSVIIPQNIVSIGQSAFESSALVNIQIPSTVRKISGASFKNTDIVSIDLSNVVEFYNAARTNGSWYPGEGIFEGCEYLSAVTLNDKLDMLPGYMFAECKNLTSIAIPSSVTSIGEKCFYQSGLKAVVIPENVESIGNSAFITSSLTYADEEGGEKVTHVNIDSKNASYYFDGKQIVAKTEQGDETAMYFASVDDDGTTITVADGVTRITKDMFADYPDVTKIILPSSVKVIKSYAFEGCTNLETVVMPAVEVIEQWAFNQCYKLNYLKLPSTITEIHYQAIRDCTNLADGGFTFDMSEVDASRATIANLLFYGTTTVGTKTYYHGLKTIILPSNMTYLPQDFLENCQNLTYVTYYLTDENGDYVYEKDEEGNVKKDADGNPIKVLAGADKGVGAFLPETLTTIYGGAFNNCTALTYVKIPAGVTELGVKSASTTGEVFYGCSNLQEVEFSSDSNITTLYGSTFYGCKALTTLNLPGSITVFGQKEFYNCSALTSIKLPNSLTEIPANLFYGCTKLETIDFDGVITSIGTYAFQNCSALTAFDTSAVTSFATSAFNGAGITSVVVNCDVSASSVFANCKSLTTVTIGAGVRTLGSSMFQGCTKLTDIAIPEGITEIPMYFLQNDTAITSVVLPNSVTTINSSAFNGCTKLATIKLSENLRSVKSGAFTKCTALTEIYIPKKVTALDGSPFQNWTAKQTISFEYDEYQVSKLYTAWNASGTCNASVRYGVAASAESGSETQTEEQTQQAA